jgi:hypothetical protein
VPQSVGACPCLAWLHTTRSEKGAMSPGRCHKALSEALTRYLDFDGSG